jgi:hypothetical protein
VNGKWEIYFTRTPIEDSATMLLGMSAKKRRKMLTAGVIYRPASLYEVAEA